MITIHGFGRVHEKVVGLTRDLRVLWALDEMGLDYRVHGIDHPRHEHLSEAYGRISPFNQMPVIEDDGFVVAESGAILLYLGEKSGKLLPAEPHARTRVTQWCWAALTTIEPPLAQLAMIDLSGSDPSGTYRRSLVEASGRPLAAIEKRLGEHEFLVDEDFTVADILLTTVLRQVSKSEVLEPYPHVRAYRERCEARPSRQRSLDAYEDRLGAPRGSAR